MSVRIRRRKTKGGRQTLFLDIYRRGEKREFVPLNLTLVGTGPLDRETMKIATRLAVQVEQKIALGEWDKRASMGESFIDYLRRPGDTNAKPVERHLMRFAGGDVPMQRVTTQFVVGFRSYLLTTKLKRNSAATYYSKFLAVVHAAQREKLLPRDLLDGAEKIKSRDAEVAFLTIDELRTLASTPFDDPRGIGRAYLLGCYTGLRKSDLWKLRWEMIDFEARVLRLIVQKTGREITLPLSASALNIIGPREGRSGLLFEPIHPMTLAKDLTRWKTLAGIEKRVTFHTSRHTFATLVQQATGNIYAVQTLLGHSSVAMSQRYARITSEAMRGAVDAIPGL